MEPTKMTFTAPGITCEGCAGAVRAVVGRVPGVTAVGVDVPAKTVTVTHAAETNLQAVAEALSRAGFPAAVSA